jgi:hypothetical protein
MGIKLQPKEEEVEINLKNKEIQDSKVSSSPKFTRVTT